MFTQQIMPGALFSLFPWFSWVSGQHLCHQKWAPLVGWHDLTWRHLEREGNDTWNKCVEQVYVFLLYVIRTGFMFMFIFLHRLRDLPFFRIWQRTQTRGARVTSLSNFNRIVTTLQFPSESAKKREKRNMYHTSLSGTLIVYVIVCLSGS